MADKPAPKADDSYSDEETARRRDATIRAMIRMPPNPHRPAGSKGKRTNAKAAQKRKK
jgi:hypothetical protein